LTGCGGLLGDYNVVLNKKERKGNSTQGRNNECWNFNMFGERLDLFDLPILGRQFTWYKGN
jgi:hypothetical protein